MYLSKFNLFNAFMNGTPCEEIGGHVISSIEREDGSNKSYNVTFIVNNKKRTLHRYVI